MSAYLRGESQERILVIQNLSADPQPVDWSLPEGVHGKIIDLLTGQALDASRRRLSLSLQPYEYHWLLIQ